MAVVGKGFAVLQTGRIQLAGFIALMGWAFVHLHYLATPGLRVTVFMQWAWTYVTGQRGARLIVPPRRVESRREADPTKQRGDGNEH
jgi:cytochrome c oxidase subunit IV